MNRVTVAKRLIEISKMMTAEDASAADTEEADPKFMEKIRSLKMAIPKLSGKKARKLRQFGIEMIRPTDSVEDLVDALIKVSQG